MALTAVVSCVPQGQITLMDAPVFIAIQPEVSVCVCVCVCVRSPAPVESLFLNDMYDGH